MRKIFLYLSLSVVSWVFSQGTLTIEQAYQYAKENSVTIKSAKYDVQLAKNKVKETMAIGLPQINGEVGYNYYIEQPISLLPAEIFGGTAGTFNAVTFGTKQSMSAGATLSQLIFNGSYFVGLQSAKAYRKISELAMEKTDQSIKEAVYLTYSSVLVIDENVKIINKNITVTKKNLSDVKEIYKVGLGEEQPIDQLNYSLLSLESTKKNLERSRENLLNGLKFLIGKKQEENITLTTPLEEILKISEILIDENSFSNWEENIDIKIAQNNLTTKKLQLKYEKSKALPSLNAFLSSTYNGYSNEFDFIGRKWYNTTLVGVQLNVPIFSGFDRKYKTQDAKIEIERAQMELENTKQKLTTDAKNGYNDYQNAMEQLETAKELQKLAEKIFNTQQIKYYEGLGSSFDLISAEAQKYQADNEYYQAINQVIQSKIKLEKTLGRL